mmetsp:Transcript_110206/g.292678  ORF Transcript_110206/g.292678 Transcript_110206/m.292678 type:complete len:228 (-) Transcript_110206:172-855(-)
MSVPCDQELPRELLQIAPTGLRCRRRVAAGRHRRRRQLIRAGTQTTVAALCRCKWSSRSILHSSGILHYRSPLRLLCVGGRRHLSVRGGAALAGLRARLGALGAAVAVQVGQAGRGIGELPRADQADIGQQGEVSILDLQHAPTPPVVRRELQRVPDRLCRCLRLLLLVLLLLLLLLCGKALAFEATPLSCPTGRARQAPDAYEDASCRRPRLDAGRCCCRCCAHKS